MTPLGAFVPARRSARLLLAIVTTLAVYAAGLALAPSLAQAQPRTIVVAPDGNDADPGTPARPKATVGGAQAALGGRGGTIELRGGTYSFHGADGWLQQGGRRGSRLVIRSTRGERAHIVSGPDSHCIGTNGSFVTVIGIECSGHRGIYAAGSHITVRGSFVHDLTAPMTQGIIVSGRGLRNIRILNNRVERVGQTGIVVGDLHVRSVANVVVAGNVVRRTNLDYQATNIYGGWGSGISTPGSVNARIIGNDVRETFGEGINCPLSDRCTVARNTVVDAYNALYYADNTTNSVWDGNVGWTTGDLAFARDYGLGPRVATGILFGNETAWFQGPRNPTNGNTVRNNLIFSAFRGFAFSDIEGNGGMRNSKILNNTFANLQWCGIDIADSANAGNEVANNVVVADRGGKGYCGGRRHGATFSHNFWTNGAPPWARSSSDILRRDPQFVVGSGTDPNGYRLQPGSPAIDSGATLAAVAVDLARTARPQGGTHDMGAFEFTG